MFNNGQSRRRFRLGNLARLVQLRQSVSHHPQPPRSTLQETLSQSPPQSPPAQPQPPSFPSPIPSASTLSPEPKSSPLSPLSPKSNEEPQSQPMPPLMPKHRNLLIQSPPKAEEFQSQPSPPLLPIETISSPPAAALLSESGESQPPLPPPPEAKTPPSSLSSINASEKFRPLLPSKSVNETQFRSSPPALSDTSETQPLLLPPERKTPSSPPSTRNSTAESQSQPLTPSNSIKETRVRSPPPPHASLPSLSESGESQQLLPPPEAKTPPSPPQNATENSQPHLLPKPMDEPRFRSPLPWQASPPSLLKSGESKPSLPPEEVKTPPAMLEANKGSQSETSPPPLPSKSIDETQFRSLPPSDEPQSPPEAKIPPSPSSTLNAIEESQSQPPPPFKSIDETRFQSPASSQTSLPNSVESQTSLPPSEAKNLQSSPSMLNANEDFRSETSPPPLLPSKSIDGTRSHSPPISPPSKYTEKAKSIPPLLSPKAAENLRSQSHMQPSSLTALTSPSPMKTLIPSPATTITAPPLSPSKSPPSMLEANKGLQSQTSPPPLPSKSIAEAQFQSLPPSLSESDESQPPPEAKIPPSPSSTLNAIEESQSQPSPPFKSVDETRFQLPVSPQTSLPNSVESRTSLPPSEAKNLQSSPSMLNANEDFRSETSPPPLLPSKSIDRTRSHSPPISPPSKYTEKPKSIPPLLSPKAAENLRSQSHMQPPSLTALTSPPPMKTPIPSPAATITAPPSLSSPLKPQIIEPSLRQTKPNQIESSSHTSPDHKKDQNYNPDELKAKLMKKIPTWNEETETGITGKNNIKNRGKAIWSEKKTEPMMLMFINSNVQGFNTSLSLDSSSIDHEPGVHLTIDSDQSL